MEAEANWGAELQDHHQADTKPARSFRQCRFSHTDFVTVQRLAGGRSAAAGEVFRLIDLLNGRAVESFPDILHLYTSSSDRTLCDLNSLSIELMRDLFIDMVDRRLQQEIYREYFAAHPLPSDANHAERIGALEGTRADAQAMVDSYDWHWLADWLQLKLIGQDAESCVRRLSNCAFSMRRVNFRFTYHCNIACRHCYNRSGPDLKADRIPLDRMLSIIAQMRDAGIRHLNLTGGEPFLYPEYLTALIAAGRIAGLRGISIYTNGYWALTAERADQTLRQLSDAGFMLGPEDYIKVSTGAYHQEFIALDRILTLARAYFNMFAKRLRVDIEKSPDDANFTDRIPEAVCDAGLAGKVDLSFRDVSPLGRGKDLNGIALHAINTPCAAIDQIVFDPDGSVRPCCGFNNENQGIVIGQLNTHSLKDLVKQMQNDPVLQFLGSNSMSGIFPHIAKRGNAIGYSGTCHLCQDAVGDLADKEPLQCALFSTQKFYPFWFTLAPQ